MSIIEKHLTRELDLTLMKLLSEIFPATCRRRLLRLMHVLVI